MEPNTTMGIPNQRLPAADQTNKYPKAYDYQMYILQGFSFMQNLVANTILRRVTDVPTAQITTVIMPEKSNIKKVDNFAIFLESALTLFILLMYVPVLFRSVYRIVFEKVSKTKESMRIMGMTDFPYWLSWFTSFSIINLVMVTACWGILMVNIISWKSSFFLFAIIWIYG